MTARCPHLNGIILNFHEEFLNNTNQLNPNFAPCSGILKHENGKAILMHSLTLWNFFYGFFYGFLSSGFGPFHLKVNIHETNNKIVKYHVFVHVCVCTQHYVKQYIQIPYMYCVQTIQTMAFLIKVLYIQIPSQSQIRTLLSWFGLRNIL